MIENAFEVVPFIFVRAGDTVTAGDMLSLLDEAAQSVPDGVQFNRIELACVHAHYNGEVAAAVASWSKARGVGVCRVPYQQGKRQMERLHGCDL